MQSENNKSVVLEIKTEDELHSAAEQLLKFAGETRNFTFSGEMGAGKTTFIKAICRMLGVEHGMSSPTFSIVNEYIGKNNRPIYHFDFYRIKSEREALEIGVEEYFESNGFCMIEWPEKILNLLPEDRVAINILVENNQRLITFSHE
ncbi:MAG: tRNA (adenosine(37)-N6)-threonylcarbamoyltransferase complex ATPase subunit type 1 TsaE [Bacteroidetes bacterium]|nr:MAG: tRNA (adenosine(37)-N6)-threonylcarbamoyltransferase complex ATPase subunit type 1 TsaE [Bacteroidota bacterium]